MLRTDPDLFRALLSFPDPERADEEQANKDFSKIPHVERLCSHLVCSSRQGDDVSRWHSRRESSVDPRVLEAVSMRTSILTFIALLSISHADALTIIMESQMLIPSLVMFLTHLSTPLWEDDVTLMTSSAMVTSYVSFSNRQCCQILKNLHSLIRILNQTLFLLHHLVFSMEPVFNLRHKLHHAPHRQFNGITHIFIVTFGRLSYADPPEWLNRKERLELEQMAGTCWSILHIG